MRAEDTSEPAEGHRPLPSVKIPLLREERRATRVKQVAAAAALVVLLAGGVSAAVILGPGGEDEEPGSEGEPEPTEAGAASAGGEPIETPPEGAAAKDAGVAEDDPPVTPDAVERVVTRFGEARAFRQAVAETGLDREARMELEKALDGVLDFRRCRPEHRLVVERDEQDRVVLFEYHTSATEYVQATRGENGELRAERVEVPLQTNRLAKGGRVTSSLGDALEAAGLGRSLAGVFISMFDSRVNFSTDTREGDAFRILVDEERIDDEFLRYGRVHAIEYVGQRTGTLHAYWFEPREGKGDYYDETGRAVQGGWLRTPCRYDHISSRFDLHRKHPLLGRVVPHRGVDYAAGRGTPVWAAADGKVTFAGRKGANGNLVSIRHHDGYETLYAHLSRFARGLERGLQVERREVIGYIGSTGRSTGPHLHFALKRHGRFLDPLEVLNSPGKRMPRSALERFKRHKKKLDRKLAEIEIGPAPVRTGSEPPKPPVDEPMD